MKTLLIIGLGNPGKKFEKTRHNAGFMFADYFRSKNRENFSDWGFSKKINGDISVGKIGNNKIILLKPQTFMNLSGEAVSAAKKYYKVKLKNIVVVHDEIDLPLGDYKFSTNCSSAGHKGAQNVTDALDTKNFTRLRIGIDNRPKPSFAKAPAADESLAGKSEGKKIPTEKYVLGKFTSNERHVLEESIKNALQELDEKLKVKN
jgi:PTH1 family peptidyl-tRNA hydrolase